jgi:hypothetical protein
VATAVHRDRRRQWRPATAIENRWLGPRPDPAEPNCATVSHGGRNTGPEEDDAGRLAQEFPSPGHPLHAATGPGARQIRFGRPGPPGSVHEHPRYQDTIRIAEYALTHRLPLAGRRPRPAGQADSAHLRPHPAAVPLADHGPPLVCQPLPRHPDPAGPRLRAAARDRDAQIATALS